jgi:hypothetical protein
MRVAADPERLAFVTSVTPGSAVRALSVVDGCGNGG